MALELVAIDLRLDRGQCRDIGAQLGRIGAKPVEVASQADGLEQDEHQDQGRGEAEDHEDRAEGRAHGEVRSKSWAAV